MAVETRSLWDSVKTPSGSGKAPTHYDVCIIGAGIAGLSAAYHLARSGRSVGVLDTKPNVAGGETQFTSAHLASILDDRFARLVSIRGVKLARFAYQSHAAAIDTIEAIVKNEKIDCDFQRLDGYLYRGEKDESSTLEEEANTVRELGIDFQRVTSQDGTVPRAGLRFPNQAQFHPLKYLKGLAEVFESAGGTIHTQTHVKAIEDGPKPRIMTEDDRTITANHVVVATNTPLNSGVVLNTKIAAYQTYAFAAPIRSGTLPPGLYWDTLDPYHYVRTYAGRGESQYVIVGGEDHKTGQGDPARNPWDQLVAWMSREFPKVELGEVKFRWSGEIFETLDGLALIGKPGGSSENIFIVTGDSGMGLTHGTIAGLLLPDLIAGREHPWAELYDPRRLPLAAAKTYLEENVNMMSQFRDWVTSGDTTLDNLRPGQSAIVRQGLKKVAVHCDDEGHCQAFSATCPHLGGVVRWNEAEGTWDCPLHGSRFTKDGKVMHGPAVDDLEPVQELALATR